MLFRSPAYHPAAGGPGSRAAAAPRRLRIVLPALITAGLTLGLFPAVSAAAAPAITAAPAPASVSAASAVPVVSPVILAIRQSQTVTQRCLDRDLLAYINKARAAYRLPPLVEAPTLVSSANRWSIHLASSTSGTVLKHNANLGATVLDGMPGARVFGENIAAFGTGRLTAYAMLKAYLGSAQHRANILNPRFRYVGVVTRSGAKGSFNTIDFAG
jgi:uncharacterized protein YkwD